MKGRKAAGAAVSPCWEKVSLFNIYLLYKLLKVGGEDSQLLKFSNQSLRHQGRCTLEQSQNLEANDDFKNLKPYISDLPCRTIILSPLPPIVTDYYYPYYITFIPCFSMASKLLTEIHPKDSSPASPPSATDTVVLRYCRRRPATWILRCWCMHTAMNQEESDAIRYPSCGEKSR